MHGSDLYGYIKFTIQSGPTWDAELRVWDAKNFGLVSPGTHRNKFVKKSLLMGIRRSFHTDYAILHATQITQCIMSGSWDIKWLWKSSRETDVTRAQCLDSSSISRKEILSS